MLALSDEHMQSGPPKDAQQLRVSDVVWGVYHESERLQGCPGHCCCHWARPASGGDSPGPSLTRSNSWDGDTHDSPQRPRSTDQCTLDTWTRVKRTAVKKFASQRTKKLVDSHCEHSYLKPCPLRSEFYLAAVGWLTLTRLSSLPGLPT